MQDLVRPYPQVVVLMHDEFEALRDCIRHYLRRQLDRDVLRAEPTYMWFEERW